MGPQKIEIFRPLTLANIHLEVERVVDVVVDLPRGPVLAEQTTQHALAADPQDLGRHARLAGTTALASAVVATLPLRLHVLPHAGARVDLHRLADDQAILDELADVEAGVRHGDLARLVRVQPDALLAALLHRGGKLLLNAETTHGSRKASL